MCAMATRGHTKIIRPDDFCIQISPRVPVRAWPGCAHRSLNSPKKRLLWLLLVVPPPPEPPPSASQTTISSYSSSSVMHQVDAQSYAITGRRPLVFRPKEDKIVVRECRVRWALFWETSAPGTILGKRAVHQGWCRKVFKPHGRNTHSLQAEYKIGALNSFSCMFRAVIKHRRILVYPQRKFYCALK